MKSDNLIFVGVWFRNFLSFSDKTQYVDLRGEKLSVILGENFDTGGEDSRNGVGKSAIIDAVSYALFGKSIRGVAGPKLVNKTMGKLMLVCLEFVRGDFMYRIERGLGPDRLTLYRKPWDNTDAWNTKDPQSKQPIYDITEKRKEHTNEKITEAIGLNFDLFEILMANSSESTPFLKMKDEDKRKIVENLIGITLLTEKGEKLKKKRLNEKKRLAELESAISATVAANKRVEAEIAEMERKAKSWETTKEIAIRQLQATIAEIEALDVDSEIEIINALDELQKAVDAAKADKRIYDTLVRSRDQKRAQRAAMEEAARRSLERERAAAERDHQREIERLEREIEKSRTELAELQRHIEAHEAGTCPTCSQPWVRDPESIDVFLAQVPEVLVEIARDEERVAELTQRGPVLPDAPALELPPEEPEPELPEDPTPTLRELEQTMGEIEQYPLSFRTAEEAIQARESVKAMRAQLEAQSSAENPHTESINNLRTNALKQVDYAEIDMSKLTIEHFDLLIDLLTRSDSFIRKAIIDKYLPVLNGKIAKYLKTLELPHKVRFNPDMTIDIGLYQEEYDYGNLSKGERTRLTLALNFAFQDLFEFLYYKINTLVVDELLDNGICARGAENGMKILNAMSNEKQKRVLLITHRDDIASRVDDVIRVRKEHGFSTIVEGK